jgi:hypothetical protein
MAGIGFSKAVGASEGFGLVSVLDGLHAATVNGRKITHQSSKCSDCHDGCRSFEDVQTM